jgi:hypothetical protein
MALILPRRDAMRPESVPGAIPLLTVPDTARRLHRHQQIIRARIRRGDLEAVRLRRLVRVFAAAVDRARALEAVEPVAGRPRSPRRTAGA